MFPWHPPKTMAILVRGEEGTSPFADELFCRRLSLKSPEFNLNIFVLVISSEVTRKLPTHGYVYRHGQWKKAPIPEIHLLMDRCLRPIPKQVRQQLHHLVWSTSGQRARYWSTSLPGKWKVHRALSGEPALRSLLTPTLLLQPGVKWEPWLDRWPSGLFFKPVAGTHGRDTFRLVSEENGRLWSIDGRDSSNVTFSYALHTHQSVRNWVESAMIRHSMIMQPYLNLSHHGHPFDIRALVQKNGNGHWSLTGCMVREGIEGSLTSNLHGGGTAHPVQSYLMDRYGSSHTAILLERIKQAATLIPSLLESRFGRLAELGIDFGADTDGRLWLLEVNSKPGRSAFAMADHPQMHTMTYTEPLAYAHYLLQQHVLTDVYRPTMKMPNTSSKAGLKPIPIHGG
ncbi:YheC/YheD family protein [Paenibacillus sp. DCT19]|uniref:YheC/YheD family endospore coat-associated protein n=1 Tax=Paenibacillus sp. DCT19 TaxID=2211212 RepID=UPI000FE1DEE3|nr:YheC/YheD family protein [Paenibacillus sp. DCT19]